MSMSMLLLLSLHLQLYMCPSLGAQSMVSVIRVDQVHALVRLFIPSLSPLHSSSEVATLVQTLQISANCCCNPRPNFAD